MRQDCVGSRTEPGCLRFDVMQDKENPCKFWFYEARSLRPDMPDTGSSQRTPYSPSHGDPARALSLPLHQVYVNAEAAEAHRDYPHFKLWTDFKASGVVSSVSSKPMFTPWGFTEDAAAGESSD